MGTKLNRETKNMPRLQFTGNGSQPLYLKRARKQNVSLRITGCCVINKAQIVAEVFIGSSFFISSVKAFNYV